MIIAAHEEPAGWGRLLGLAVAVGLFLAIVRVHRWLVASGRLPSPTGKGSRSRRVKPQVKDGSDPGDPADDPSDEEVREYDWGSVSGRGSRVEVVLHRHGEQETRGDFDTWVREQLGKLRPADIIREARRHFGRSESTTKRAMRRARKGDR